MYPKWILILNIILEGLGVILGILVIKESIKVSLGVLIAGVILFFSISINVLINIL